MKKLWHKLRIWLLDLLDGISWEDAVKERLEYESEYDRLNTRIGSMSCQIWRYKEVVREICRRSDDSYYDWCCDYCKTPCSKRNGWCKRFEPESTLCVGIKDRFTAGDIAK